MFLISTHCVIICLIYVFNFFFKAEDYIDEILNYDSIAESIKYEINSVNDIKIKQEPQSVTEADKDRQKKDNHNMSKYSSLKINKLPTFINKKNICSSFFSRAEKKI